MRLEGYMKKGESVGVVYTDGDKFLAVVSSGNRKIGLPKGMKDKGESTVKTAMREFFEETGQPLFRRKLEQLGKYPYNDVKDIVLFKYKLDKLPPISAFKCLSHFDPSYHYKGYKKGSSLPEVESYKYIDIDNYNQLYRNYHQIFKKIKDKLK